MLLEVPCPNCGRLHAHDVPEENAGDTEYPTKCPHCGAEFKLWLDEGFFW